MSNESSFERKLATLRDEIETLPEEQRAHLRQMADRIARVHRESLLFRDTAHQLVDRLAARPATAPHAPSLARS